MSDSIIGIGPLQYIHVLNVNSSRTRLVLGPQTFVKQANEKVVAGPLPCIIVPPGHYCTVLDPCSKSKDGIPLVHDFGHKDIRFHGEPFALFPGESLLTPSRGVATQALPVVRASQGLLVTAVLDHKDADGTDRCAADQWMIRGPRTYKPQPQVDIIGFRNECVIKPGESLLLQAVNDFTDITGVERITGEKWLISKPGGYLNDVFEEVVEVIPALTLTETMGVHLRAEVGCTDNQGVKREAGQEWLVTGETTDTLYHHVHISVVKKITKTVLAKGQYCFVVNPVDKKNPMKVQLGCREVVTGPHCFFLHPGESLEGEIQEAYVIGPQQAIVLRAAIDFTEKEEGALDRARKSGETWMVHGPVSYIPCVEVEVVIKRSAIPLNKNEGIYVQNMRTGHVRAVMGPQAYLLKEYEKLFHKKLSDLVETLLKSGGGAGSGDIRKIAYFEQSIDPALLKGRDPSRVVTYRCPGNTACQVFNYKHKTARVVFGPDLVVLGPDENFNVLSLSAGKPKKAHALTSLALMLGPDFISDIIVVETSDHARLQIQMAFNNYFEYDVNDPKSCSKLFSVPDFIGYASQQIGGRVRAAVALISFDEFHKNSKAVIQHAVFDTLDTAAEHRLKFDANNLVISGVDVQSIEPVDMKMRESLMKSVQMAIEIATQSIEASASHEAQRIEQIARGELGRQKLTNEMESEKARVKLFELQAETAAVESTGQAVAEARANAESMIIEGQSHIECARLKTQANSIESHASLELENNARTAEIAYVKATNQMEVSNKRNHAAIETEKFKRIVSSLGANTIKSIATAGPDMQVKLLSGLGLQSTLITDGTTPINLFNTAQGLIGASSY